MRLEREGARQAVTSGYFVAGAELSLRFVSRD